MPFASILTAQRLELLINSNKFKKIYLLQLATISFLLIFIIALKFIAFPGKNFLLILSIIIFLGSILFSFLFENKYDRFFIPSISGTIILSFILNIGILKPLLSYQSESEAALFLANNSYDGAPVFLFKENKGSKSRSFNFYLNVYTTYIDDFKILNEKCMLTKSYIFTNENGYKQINRNLEKVKLLKVFEHFRISKVNFKFIKYSTRKEVIQKKYLLQVG